MKVVINVCFGGFGLSTEAVKLCITRGSKAVKSMTIEKYTGGRGLSLTEHSPLEDVGDGYQAQRWMPGVLYKDGNVFMIDSDYETHAERTDPVVVAVVEELGNRANGAHAELSVVEIPDGVEWEIDEYDGNEHIAEVHRTWR